MSTLKKILALTMAIAMVLSLNVFAAFKDQDKINEDCVDAMELMDALGIMKGDDKGNANPSNTITRAEAAAMIFRLMNKGKDDATIYEGAKVFTDVATGIWYDGYVTYAYTMNIIAGRTATTFDPQAPVTGYEIAKMLLCCLKYRQDTEGYTGANWTKNVQNDAFMAGMLDNYGMALSAPAQRQWVAVMFADALGSLIVKYSDGEAYETEETLLANKFNLDTEEGVVTAIGELALPGTTGTAKYTTLDSGATFKKLAADAMLGESVKVYYKANSTTVYGIFATGDNVVGEDMLYNCKETDGTYTVGDLKMKLDRACIVAVNNVDFELVDASSQLDKIGSNSTATVKAIDNDDDEDIDVILVTTSLYGEVKIAKSGKVTFAGQSVAADDVKDDVNFVNKVADGDFVKVTANVYTGKYDIEALESTVGMVTRISGSTYTIGGTSYKASEDAVVPVVMNFNLKDQVELYTDGKFVVSAAKKDSTASDGMPTLVLVTAAGQKANDDIYDPSTMDMVKALGIDNKVTEYEIDSDMSVTGAVAWNADTLIGNVYELVDNADGTYTLANLQNTYGDPVKYTKKDGNAMVLKVSTSRLGNVRIASDTKMFMKYVKDANASPVKYAYTVVSVADLKGDQTWGTGNWYYSETKSGLEYLTVGYFGGNFNANATDAVYAVVTKNAGLFYDATDDETYYDFTVIYASDPTTEVTLVSKKNLDPFSGVDLENQLVTVSEDNGVYTVAAIPGSPATVAGVDSSSVLFASGTLTDVTDDVVVGLVVIDADGEETFEFVSMSNIVDVFDETGDDADNYTYSALTGLGVKNDNKYEALCFTATQY